MPAPSRRETFYDGYVVNGIIDAVYRSAASKRWEPVDIEWRGGSTPPIAKPAATFERYTVIKEEVLPDGRRKMILKDPDTGEFHDRIV